MSWEGGSTWQPHYHPSPPRVLPAPLNKTFMRLPPTVDESFTDVSLLSAEQSPLQPPASRPLSARAPKREILPPPDLATDMREPPPKPTRATTVSSQQLTPTEHTAPAQSSIAQYIQRFRNAPATRLAALASFLLPHLKLSAL
eukprot:m.214572 g.214572  ORF g.214572 m.214572 type:complete len:143 (-) comp54059_c0_seq7:1400-1828(-)